MNKFQNTFYILFLSATIVACSSDEEDAPIAFSNQQMIIANEGGFTAVNAELTSYDLITKTVHQSVYHNANMLPLGDVLQDIYVYAGELYAVVNNSSKIEVMSLPSFQSQRVISGISSPNAMCFLSESRAFVSDLYSPTVYEINPKTGVINSQIPMQQPVDQLIKINSEVWCTSYTGGLFIFDIETNTVVSELDLVTGASGILQDHEGKVWVLSQGDYWSFPITSATLYRIDASTREILSTFVFSGATSYGGKLAISPNGQTVYFTMSGDVIALPIDALELPTEAFIASDSRVFYGINVDPVSGDLALSDAGDFVSAGKVYIYQSDGNFKEEIPTGIVPDDVIWVRF